MAKLFVVKLGADRYVKRYHRTRHIPSVQYSVIESTDVRSDACEMSWNQARSVSERNNGSIAAA